MHASCIRFVLVTTAGLCGAPCWIVITIKQIFTISIFLICHFHTIHIFHFESTLCEAQNASPLDGGRGAQRQMTKIVEFHIENSNRMQHITCICDSLDLIVVLRCSRRLHHGHRSPVTGTYRPMQIRTENGFSESGLEFSIITYHIHRSRINTLTERGRKGEGGRYAIFMETRFSQLLLLDGGSMAICLPPNEIESFELNVTIEGPWPCRTTANPFRPHEAYLLWVFIFNFLFRLTFVRHSALTHICLRASVWIKLNGIESRTIVNSAQNHHTRRIMRWEQPKSWYNLKMAKSKWRQCKDRSLKQQHQRLWLGQMRKEEHRKQQKN